MRKKLLQIILFTLLFFLISYSPAFCSGELYDALLEGEDISPSEETVLPPSEGENLPRLDGVWTVKKHTLRRRQPTVITPVKNLYCVARMPFDEWDFEKEVVISGEERPGKYTIRKLCPEDLDIYIKPEKRNQYYTQDKKNYYINASLTDELKYHNFGFKGLIDPEDLTYSYNLKLANYYENPGLTKYLSLNGRIFYKHVSSRSIKGEGYELVESPHCHGFILDEISIEFKKVRDIKRPGETIIAKEPVPPAFKQLTKFDTAKDKSGFEPSPTYTPIDTEKPWSLFFPPAHAIEVVPGLW